MTADPLAPLLTELDRWSASGRTARLWLRDDDATQPTPALDRLLALTGRHAVPLTLAVIPEPTGRALADRLAAEHRTGVAVHGWAHRNHAAEGRKACELGPERRAETVLADLSHGLAKLAALYGPRLVPVLVPPWNRIAPDLIPRLAGTGFTGLSVFGPEPGQPPLPYVNTHADLIDWRGTRGGRPPSLLAEDLASRLATLRDTGDDRNVAGLLTHHLVHDDQAWETLDAILTATAGHPGATWVPLSEALVRP